MCWVIVSLESFPARFVCVKARDTIVEYAPGSAEDAPNPLPPSQMLLLARAKQMYKSTPLPDSTKTLDNKLSSNRSVAARLWKLFICKTAAYSSKARLVCFGRPRIDTEIRSHEFGHPFRLSSGRTFTEMFA